MINKKFVIIGAGACGISLSYFLKKNGVSKITIFEKDLIGSGSTGKCAGIVSIQLWNEIDIKLARRSLEIFEEISRKFPYFKINRNGLITIGRQEKSKKYIEKIAELLKEEKISFEIFEDKKIKEEFPFIKDYKNALLLKTFSDLYVDSGMFLYVLYSYLKKENVEFRLLREVENFKVSGNEIKGIWVKGIYYPGDIFILCSGVWSKKILEKLGVNVPILPYRTQAGILRKKGKLNIPIIHDVDKKIYIRNEADDRFLVGDGTEHKEASFIYNEIADGRFVYEVLPKVSEILEDFEDAEYMGGWAGLCDATPDRHPILGKIDDFENLYIISGFNGFGFMRIPAIAENFSLYLLENKMEIDLSPYFFDRFKNKLIDKFEIRDGFLHTD
jgi:sarcosine oxidase subunit beta